MGKKQQQQQRESKPLLDKGQTSGTTTTTAAATSNPSPAPSTSKKSKPKAGTLPKPKLASVHEASLESPTAETSSGAGTQSQESQGAKRGRRARKQQQDDDDEKPKAFGIRDYLHHFYEQKAADDPNYQYLIHPKNSKSKFSKSLCFKLGLCIGATLLLLGASAIIIGYAIPRQTELRGQTEEYKIIDRNAIKFNKNLDWTKLAGLAGFCSGGVILVITLLSPTLANSYWEEQDTTGITEPFRVATSEGDDDEEEAIAADESGPKSPLPVTEKVKCVQPVLIPGTIAGPSSRK